MNLDFGQYIVIIVCALLAMWYLLGGIINRRRGMATFNWLRSGMAQFGDLTEARWIGSAGSGARLIVAKANSPFHRVEVVFLLESREILPLWIVNHLRGKRDEMILKASLRTAPPQELEAARSGNREFTTLVASGGKKPFVLLSGPAGFELARRGRVDEPGVERLRDFLSEYESSVWRVSLGRDAPHLILRANLPHLIDGSAEDFFAEVGQLVE